MILVYCNEPDAEAIRSMLAGVPGFKALFGNCFELPDDAEFPAVPATMLRAPGDKFSAGMLVVLKAAHRLLPGSTLTLANAPAVRPPIYHVPVAPAATVKGSVASQQQARPPRRRPISGERASEFAPESVTRLGKKLARVVKDRALSFVRAVTGPRVPDEVAEARLKQCLSNECGYLRTDGDQHYCSACGCPRWKLAELTNKVRYAKLACPCEPPYWGEYES
jgi:hypothetical protein